MKTKIGIIVVMIILAGVASLVFFNSHKKKKILNECINNQRMIDSMVYNLEMAEKLTKGTQITEEMLRNWHMYPSKWWNCPAGGTYEFPKVGENPECSIHGSLLKEQ